MNRIYLFGKVISKSNLKYALKPRLRIYILVIIKTFDGNKFECIVKENLCDKLRFVEINDYIYIAGFGSVKNEMLEIHAEQVYF